MQTDLFGDALPEKQRKKRTETWVVVDHLCTVCMGRLLVRRISPNISEVRCSECDERRTGSELALCWCGVEVGQYGRMFECIPNPNPRPELRNMILVREKPVQKEKTVTPSRKVATPDSYRVSN